MGALDWAKHQTKLLLPSQSLATHWRWLTGPPSCCCEEGQVFEDCAMCQSLTAPSTMTLILSGGAPGPGGGLPPIASCANCDCLDGSHVLPFSSPFPDTACSWVGSAGCQACAVPDFETGLSISIVNENSGAPDFIDSIVMYAQAFQAFAFLFTYTKTLATGISMGGLPPLPDCSIFDEILTGPGGGAACSFDLTCRVVSP